MVGVPWPFEAPVKWNSAALTLKLGESGFVAALVSFGSNTALLASSVAPTFPLAAGWAELELDVPWFFLVAR